MGNYLNCILSWQNKVFSVAADFGSYFLIIELRIIGKTALITVA